MKSDKPDQHLTQHSSCCGAPVSILESEIAFGIRCASCDCSCDVVFKKDRPFLYGDVIHGALPTESRYLLGLKDAMVISCAPGLAESHDVTLVCQSTRKVYYTSCDLLGKDFREGTPF